MSFGIAVFPCLKTSSRFRLGGFEFRSTDDIDGLPQDQKDAVQEIAAMLFLKDDLRIVSSTFAIIPTNNDNHKARQLDLLARIRLVVAYAYSSPHETIDNILLTPEEASLVFLTPASVFASLVFPDHHVLLATGAVDNRAIPDELGMI